VLAIRKSSKEASKMHSIALRDFIVKLHRQHHKVRASVLQGSIVQWGLQSQYPLLLGGIPNSKEQLSLRNVSLVTMLLLLKQKSAILVLLELLALTKGCTLLIFVLLEHFASLWPKMDYPVKRAPKELGQRITDYGSKVNVFAVRLALFVLWRV